MNLRTVKPSIIMRRALAVVSAAGMAAVALLPATPAAAEPDGDPRMKCVRQAPYYFHGLPLVEGTFDQTEPDPGRGDLPSFQPAYNSGIQLPQRVRWSAGFAGRLCEEIDVTLYVAKAAPGGVHLWVYGPRSLVGSSYGVLASTGGLPAEHGFRVGVDPNRAAVSDTLRFEITLNGIHDATVYYDHPDYAAGFRVSTLEPCEVDDPHPDCEFTDGLRNLVNGFADSGQVTDPGRVRLLGVLDDAKAAFDSGDADATVAALEEFKRLASDPELVTTTAARDGLIAGADTLIAAVQGTG